MKRSNLNNLHEFFKYTLGSFFYIKKKKSTCSHFFGTIWNNYFCIHL